MVKSDETQIKCPFCHKRIPLDKVIKHQIEEKLQTEFESKLEKVKAEETKKADKRLRKESERIQKASKKEASEEVKSKIEELSYKLRDREGRLKKAQENEAELRKAKIKIEKDREEFELTVERRLEEERKKIGEEVSKQVHGQHNLEVLEYKKQIDDYKKKLDEAKLQLQQGSSKLRGEVLELELEDQLKNFFVDDTIEPIASGVRGADILQKVCQKSGKMCGKILFESKRATKWSNKWISKLKKDQLKSKADIAVLVSTVVPEDINGFTVMQGVCVVEYNYVIPLAALLRTQIMEIDRVKRFDTGREKKQDLLYDHITSNEFRQRVQSFFETLVEMAVDLQRERTSMERMWAKREQQLKNANLGIVNVVGGLQGILGSSMPEIETMELLQLTDEEPKKRRGGHKKEDGG